MDSGLISRLRSLLSTWSSACGCMMLLSACPSEAPEAYTPIPLEAGSPRAGVHTTFLQLPAGVPLGAYTARDVNLGLGGASATQPEDRRNSPWAHKFFPSIGYASGISLDALWLTNGDRNLVMITADLGAAFDGLLFAIEKELSERTGVDVIGQVILATNHTHSAPAAFHGSLHFAPGFDRYDPRIAKRMVSQFVDAAEAAFRDLEPVRLGFGILEDFDPIGEDEVFRDRRPENDSLPDHAGNSTGAGYKDPRAHLLKVEKEDGTLKAVGLHLGLHGTLFDAENHWAHWDAPGAIKHGTRAALGGTPVLFLQGYAGDVSPVRRGPPLAAADRLARISGPRIADAVAAVQTSAQAFFLDAATITIDQSLESTRVTRRGTTDFRYKDFSYDWENRPSEAPDNQIYDDKGDVIQLIDEFPAPTGAGLCNSDTGPALVAIGFGLKGPDASPYDYCVAVDQFGALLTELYEMTWSDIFESTDKGARTKEPGMRSTTLSFAKLDGIALTEIQQEAPRSLEKANVALLSVPGEPCTLFGFRAEAYIRDLGYDAAMVVGYAQDHEGYLMTVEDWLAGGYEPGINIWGPLQGEYILESAVPMAERGLRNEQIRTDDISIGAQTDLNPVGFEALPETRHVTPNAGQQLQSPLPESQFLVLPVGWSRDSFDPLQPPTEVAALSGLYYAAFEGGDVAIDSPSVELEYAFPDGFAPIDLGDGMLARHTGPGTYLSYTPSPAKTSDAWQERRHFWVIAWQPVGEGIEDGDWSRVPLGTYRFRVRGRAIQGQGQDVTDYEFTLPEFRVVGNEIETSATGTRFALAYPRASLGTRLRGVEGEPEATSPLPAGMQVVFSCADGTTESVSVDGNGTVPPPAGPLPCDVQDEMGNAGRIETAND